MTYLFISCSVTSAPCMAAPCFEARANDKCYQIMCLVLQNRAEQSRGGGRGGEHVMSCLMEQLGQGGAAMTSSCSEVLMQVNTGR